MEKKNKILVGPGNIAGFAKSTAKALRTVNIDALSVSYEKHPFGYPCDNDGILINYFPDPTKRKKWQRVFYNKYTIKLILSIQKLLFFAKNVFKFDVFFFISTETFFKNNLDLRLIKILRKKIYFQFVGCPERDPLAKINNYDGGLCVGCNDHGMKKYLNCYKNSKIKKSSKIIKSADYIFAHRDTSTSIEHSKKVKKFYCITDSTTDRDEIILKYEKMNIPKIVHLPSNKLVKGTFEIEQMLAGLRDQGYSFEYWSSRVQNSQVAKILRESHILIDQFNVGPGLLSTEGMAQGCVVICRMADWFKEDFPECPVVSCEIEELDLVLKQLLANPKGMLDIALKSYDYYKKYHTYEAVGNYYKSELGL